MTPELLFARVGALSPRTKGTAIAAVAAAVVLSLLGAIAMHPARTQLFAQPLRPEQLSEVEERLAQWNVAFTPVSDNVIVDTARRNDTLLRLSLAGVPHPHVTTTDEALATVGVLTPQAVVDAQTRAGLAGEIEIGLRSIDGVDDARVIIAPAKVAEFADQSASDASASVRLQLRPGARLSRASINGIRAFVAASVTGLDPAHVTILDDHGVAMNAEASSGDDASALQASLQSALDDALGAGGAIVRVHVEYSPTARETRDVRRSPLGPIARDATTESFAGQGRRYQKDDERDERGSDTQERVARTAPGALVRISTAIFVDARRTASLETVRALAAATVGFDAKRGDSLAVQAVDFYHQLAPRRDVWFLLYGAIVPLLPALALVLGCAVLVRFASPYAAEAIRAYVQRTSIARTSSAVSGFSPSQVRGALAHEPPHAAAAIISALPAATAAAVLELYPASEREAIVRRMQRAHSPLIPDAAELLARHV